MTDGAAQLGPVLDCAGPERLAGLWASALRNVDLGTAGNRVGLFPNGAPGSTAP